MRKTVVIVGVLLAVDVSAVERLDERPVWSVREHGGSPGLWRGGEPVTPMAPSCSGWSHGKLLLPACVSATGMPCRSA